MMNVLLRWNTTRFACWLSRRAERARWEGLMGTMAEFVIVSGGWRRSLVCV